MRVVDPNLLATFVRADLNTILQDPAVRVSEVCNFARNKYNITAEEIASITDFQTVARLMATTEEILSHSSQATTVHAAGAYSSTGVLHVYSHIAPLGGPSHQAPHRLVAGGSKGTRYPAPRT